MSAQQDQAAANNAVAKSERQIHTDHIIKKFGLEDIIPRASDFDNAKANLLPLDGSTPIFAGGRPIKTRRESSSPAVEEALARGFKLAHFPARALLPEDQFKNMMPQGGGGVGKTTRIQHHHHPTPSPDPAIPGETRTRSSSPAAVIGGGGAAATRLSRGNSPSAALVAAAIPTRQTATVADADGTAGRIPGNISPHVLPQNLLMLPLPPARELLEMDIPLRETSKYEEKEREWIAGVEVGDWALSDPAYICGLSRHFRRCFPRTERDDQHDDFPTSRFSGNYILRRYGGCFPEHCHYSFYRKYGEFGLGAVTAEFHNFPAGRHPLAPI